MRATLALDDALLSLDRRLYDDGVRGSLQFSFHLVGNRSVWIVCGDYATQFDLPEPVALDFDVVAYVEASLSTQQTVQ